MEHLSEVTKILEAALRHDPRKASDYASLLASKLEGQGQLRQARALLSILAKTPAPAFSTAGVGAKIPKDKESQLETVDVLQPIADQNELILHPYVESKVVDFLNSVRSYEKWQAAGIATPNRILIYGPPGTGKTSIAHWIASQLNLPLVTSRSDTLVSSLLGQTSRNLRQVFEYAESFPCVLFLDEFDALAKNRADTREIGELQRVVIALLQNIDALSSSTILIAATNHESLLDPAIWRRFESSIKVGLPLSSERKEIWRSKLGTFSLSEKDLDRLVKYSHGMSGSAIQTAAFDIVRESHRISPPSPVPLPVALRRLARILWSDKYDRFENTQAEMIALKNWAPEVYSIRALSAVFGLSTRQVSKALMGDNKHGKSGTDFVASRAASGSEA